MLHSIEVNSKPCSVTYPGLGDFEFPLVPESKAKIRLVGIRTGNVFTKSSEWSEEVQPETNIYLYLPNEPNKSREIAGELFDQLEEQRSDENKIVELISYIRSQKRIPFAERLANRLEYLVEASQEEYPYQSPISSESLRWFVYLLISTPNLVYPDVVLSPSGNIRVEWHAARNRHFAIEFSPDGNARFVVFAPDSKHPMKTSRFSGIVSVEALIETVRPYGVLKWSLQQVERDEG